VNRIDARASPFHYPANAFAGAESAELWLWIGEFRLESFFGIRNARDKPEVGVKIAAQLKAANPGGMLTDKFGSGSAFSGDGNHEQVNVAAARQRLQD
jgi:hypothetical protein